MISVSTYHCFDDDCISVIVIMRGDDECITVM